jgi:uncharacterized protein DUF1404
LRPKRPSVQAALSHGWLAGPLLFAAVVSPPVAAAAEQSLVVHHVAHWVMVVAGALIGYQFRDAVRLPARGVFAAAGLVAALTWHVPPLLGWAESQPATHAFAHLTLAAGGAALGWAVPGLSSAGRAYLFVAANVVMWPLVLAELAGAFVYTSYSGQAAAAGVVELVAMSTSWFVIFGWAALRRLFTSPAASLGVQAVFALSAIAGWSWKIVL